MSTAVKLKDIALFSQKAGLFNAKQFDPETIKLTEVEVIPEERKWILHLSACTSFTPEEISGLAEDLEKTVKGQIKIECRFERERKENTVKDHDGQEHRTKDGSVDYDDEHFRGYSDPPEDPEGWQNILCEFSEAIPALKGLINSGSLVAMNGQSLTFSVPNLVLMESLRSRQGLMTDLLERKFGVKYQICWEITEETDINETWASAEIEEQKYVEQIMAVASAEKKKDQKGSDLVIGRDFKGEAVPLRGINDEERQVIIAGEVCEAEIRRLKSGRQLFTFGITDKTNSLGCKLFLEEGQPEPNVNKGDWLRLRGPVQFDRYTTELTMMPKDIVKIPGQVRMDTAEVKRVELHLHTKMSEMDAVSSAQSLVRRAALWGHQAIAITDHGVVQAFPDAVESAEKSGIKVILGMEGYLIEDDPQSQGYYHVIILAKNQTGLNNLYQLVTGSHIEHFYRRPRISKSQLKKYREGLIIGSACEAGELMRAVLRQASWEDLKKIASFYDYLEIQPTGNNQFLIPKGEIRDEEGLRDLNRTIVKLGDELGKPVAATCDVHFLDAEDEVFRRILMAGKGYEDADTQAPLYFRTTDEMLEEFSYLGEDKAYEVVVTNTVAIAEGIENLKPFPDGFFEPKIEGAAERIKEMALKKAAEQYGDPLPDTVAKALQKELHSIIGNGFAVLYLIAHLLVKKSNEDGYLVGSRGSVGSSLVATMTGITEVNPLPPHYHCTNPSCLYSEFLTDGSAGSGVDLPDKTCPRCGLELSKDGHDIPFETFLGFKGDKVPDIDLNFSGEYQPRAHKYTEEIFGKENVFRAGTISTVAEKTAFGFVKNYLDERSIKYNQTELNRLVRGCAGVKRTTGQHPGGLMVIPKECDVYNFTPLQKPANDSKTETITTHFDYHSISGRLVKLDILGHDDPTMIKMLEDFTGIDAQEIRLDDERTLSLFSSPEALGVKAEDIGSNTGTFGVPEFGTKFVRQMLEDTKPKTFSHLVRISGLSHGTNVWLGNAQDLVLNGTADISQIIACRDDIMVYLIQKGLDPQKAFKIMEQVRKGKGLKADDVEEMLQFNVPQWYIDSCQKISYMFPKAHAVAYVMMAFRIAWFKLNCPEAFYAAFFTVRAEEFDAEMICQGLDHCKKIAAEMAGFGNKATQKEKGLLTILELAIEMYCRGISLRKVDLWESDATTFQITDTGILPPFSSIQGLGETAANSLVALRRENKIRSVEDMQTFGKISKPVVEVLQKHGCLNGLPERNQLSLF
ncbi:DNA polymerase III, alpha subunit [Syntrophobotulus glycolicus DSM 8271]|uniref:DNA polymerase III PolC-type n=1 Tax=Syntrophobotulus glycolicus (strain DSM 8271 / FlGlyR) TaxID=645991 RepID=F0SU95_SYNGF|nr:DNA polymerase III, alpha subunit [Syntrophobotulus glycolicus DSM 8271]